MECRKACGVLLVRRNRDWLCRTGDNAVAEVEVSAEGPWRRGKQVRPVVRPCKSAAALTST